MLPVFQARPKARSVREEPSFAAAAQQIEPDVRRFDELAAAAIYLIEGDADSLPILGNSPFRMARAHIGRGDPIVRILFTINSDDQCSLWYVDFIDDPSNEAGLEDPEFENTEGETAG